ncbi:DUF4383 domain-containing protein [Microbacterium stercoris]|uniref:DUF4383 domain-containing protein n=1 Tax=Microbacterium stercoris TaxID=2820289 RepID=A0A939TP15_9MICO|nr:DUF4383 domain-containing protein [Microbacterium stercoris]MBO3661920.1 DUF4383 domain-containing protein [Microbacterium stercoris]
MSTAATRGNGRYAETPVQKAALVFGIVFFIVGIAGFIPGLTSNVDALEFAGHESGAMLLGIFQVSILHNIVHLLFGVLGLVTARTFSGSRGFLIWGGAIYAVLWIYGLVVPHDHQANFVPLNTADNWLHFVLAAAMIALGVLLGRRVRDARTV